MKKLFVMMALVMCFVGASFAQAHIGSTASEIKSFHPGVAFQTDYAEDGTKYMFAEMPLGIFFYYFNSYGVSEYCIQVPYTMGDLNLQVEIYNGKYVILSDNSWKAYLEGGGTMNIELTYWEEQELYVFFYFNN